MLIVNFNSIELSKRNKSHDIKHSLYVDISKVGQYK